MEALSDTSQVLTVLVQAMQLCCKAMAFSLVLSRAHLAPA